ncbi:MAG: hypothetical protein V1896_01325 [Candidatus Zambryskibacteria bacterium]
MLRKFNELMAYLDREVWPAFLGIAISSGLLLFTIMQIIRTEEPRPWSLVFGGLLLSMSFIGLGRCSAAGATRVKYEKIFGLPFPYRPEEKRIHQPLVNSVLKILSESFHTACNEKEFLLKSLPGTRSLTEGREFVNESLSRLEGLENDIKKRKETFWFTHAVARKAGMYTLKKSGDYLQLK